LSTDATHAQLVTPLDEALLVAGGYLAGYSGHTLTGYRIDLRAWFTHCEKNGLVVLEVKRVHVEMFGRQMEADGYARATIGRRLSTVAGFYRYCEAEDILAKSPARFVRRPKSSQESSTLGLDRMELGAFITHAAVLSPLHHALGCLLNGLRVSEACGADVEALGSERGHRTLRIIGKGAKPATVPLAPRTARAIDLVVGDRFEGPLFAWDGRRLDRFTAGRMVRATAKRAGITKKVGPHSLRHSFITAALDAGVPLRDVQVAARHADPRTTTRYDRDRMNLDRHAAYIVCAFVAGAA